MTREDESPLIPNSLAADGMQGASAKAEDQCEAQHSAAGSEALFEARKAIIAAEEHLDRYALTTDAPFPGAIDAADLLEAARAALGRVQ